MVTLSNGKPKITTNSTTATTTATNVSKKEKSGDYDVLAPVGPVSLDDLLKYVIPLTNVI